MKLLRRLRCLLVGHVVDERVHYMTRTVVHICRCRRCGKTVDAKLTRARQYPWPRASR